MIIEKKIWPKYFEAIKQGKKKFELRLADFKIKEGDILVLKEWNPESKEYTGRKIKRKVKYVLNYKLGQFWPKKEVDKYGFYIIQI